MFRKKYDSDGVVLTSTKNTMSLVVGEFKIEHSSSNGWLVQSQYTCVSYSHIKSCIIVDTHLHSDIEFNWLRMCVWEFASALRGRHCVFVEFSTPSGCEHMHIYS